jgi:hypothetical protein
VNEFTLKEEYLKMGFQLVRFGDKAFAITHNKKVVFAFRSGMDISDAFLKKICDSYLEKMENS